MYLTIQGYTNRGVPRVIGAKGTHDDYEILEKDFLQDETMVLIRVDFLDETRKIHRLNQVFETMPPRFMEHSLTSDVSTRLSVEQAVELVRLYAEKRAALMLVLMRVKDNTFLATVFGYEFHAVEEIKIPENSS